MSVYYDLYTSGNPQKKEEQQALYARVIPSGTINADKFVELVSKSNGFSPATIEGCLQAVSDELQHWLAQGWTVEVGEIGHFSLSLTCDRPVMEKKEIRSPSIHLNKVNLRINKKFRESLEPLQLERIESPYRTNNDSNEERCRTLLIQHLDKHGCITRTDFMRLAEISRNKAIELLNKFLKEEIIRKYGGGKTVVYLKKVVFLISTITLQGKLIAKKTFIINNIRIINYLFNALSKITCTVISDAISLHRDHKTETRFNKLI